LVPSKRLIHSFIEGPRCDLIYRGTAILQNGQAIVNLDRDCVAEPDCQMTEGTFAELTTNSICFLQNNESFDSLKYSISNNILTIDCENNTSSDTIQWLVIAERKDQFIKNWDKTNADGFLKTEYSASLY